MTTRSTKTQRDVAQRGQQGASFGGPRPKGKAAKKGRRPAPVKVGKDRNWAPIAIFAAVAVLAGGLIGYAFWAQRGTEVQDWQERAAAIPGIVDYRTTQPQMLTRTHRAGQIQYEVLPPVGGDHNERWQNCQGNVYTEPIANEHAVHSLEHGAVWITYNPDLLSDSQINSLADLVEGNDKMFMSPFPTLDAPISLQAWGYQLKVDSPGDSRITDFIRALRANASLEGMAATCSGGVTTTGTVPIG